MRVGQHLAPREPQEQAARLAQVGEELQDLRERQLGLLLVGVRRHGAVAGLVAVQVVAVQTADVAVERQLEGDVQRQEAGGGLALERRDQL